MENYIKARNYFGLELLEAQIIREGVLLIQKGAAMETLREKLAAMLGENDDLKEYGQWMISNLEH